jgi:hypothetical protein
VGEAAREHRPQNATATITDGDGGAQADQASGPHAEARADPGPRTHRTTALTARAHGFLCAALSAAPASESRAAPPLAMDLEGARNVDRRLATGSAP